MAGKKTNTTKKKAKGGGKAKGGPEAKAKVKVGGAAPPTREATNPNPPMTDVPCPWKPECPRTVQVWNDAQVGDPYTCDLAHESVVSSTNPLRLTKRT
jgi:hypothetical protein